MRVTVAVHGLVGDRLVELALLSGGLLLNMPSFEVAALFLVWVRVNSFRLISADGVPCISCMFSHCRVPYMSTSELFAVGSSTLVN